ncbi:hypothetical protein KR018_005665 [Drosophila ironensis]|nr:hypothetical protein KR018_005665 [Drosophila ironensis]
MASIAPIPVQLPKLLNLFRTVVPKLTAEKYKGQCGRIGLIGGCMEYTGAPYFAAIASMKVGADLSHVFCHGNAASVIKAYSPDLIVHPVLDCSDAVDKVIPWLERIHVIVIGPGLGRDPTILKTATELLNYCLRAQKPVIIDADGLYILNDNISLVCGMKNVILTPNVMEFRRLFGEDPEESSERISILGEGVVVLEKGFNDKIHIPQSSEIHILPTGGSGRRCGGQGDILSGSLATFFYWTLQSKTENPAYVAACASSYFVKQLNTSAYQKFGRSLLASDMINEIPTVFMKNFENICNQDRILEL